MDWLHRATTGQTISPTELRIGGFFILLWFIMDLVQWLDWLNGKLNPVVTTACQ